MFAEYCENIFLRMCCWKWQLVNVGKLIYRSTFTHSKTNIQTSAVKLLRE